MNLPLKSETNKETRLREWRQSNICQFQVFFNIFFCFWVLFLQLKAKQWWFAIATVLFDSFLPRISLTLVGFTKLAPVRPGIRNWSITVYIITYHQNTMRIKLPLYLHVTCRNCLQNVQYSISDLDVHYTVCSLCTHMDQVLGMYIY